MDSRFFILSLILVFLLALFGAIIIPFYGILIVFCWWNRYEKRDGDKTSD